MDCPPGQWPLHVERLPLVEVRLHFKAVEKFFHLFTDHKAAVYLQGLWSYSRQVTSGFRVRVRRVLSFAY